MPTEGRLRAPVYILLATCQGVHFLDELLISLRAQTDPDWVVLVSDDASTDRSAEIVMRHAAEDSRVVMLEPCPHRIGIRENFGRLMLAALERGAALFALCDQDDIWLPTKIGRLRAAVQSCNSASASAQPVLAYADLRLIDEEGLELAPSHFRHAGADCVRTGVGPWLLAHNLIPGCAIVGNRALLELAVPFPPAIHHHDWWLLVLAAAAGRVVAVDAVLTEYRQHGANAIGAAGPWRRACRFVTGFRAQLRRAREQYALALAQADALVERMGERTEHSLDPAWSEWVAAARTGLGGERSFTRLRAVLRGPVRRLGLARNVLMLAVATLPRA